MTDEYSAYNRMSRLLPHEVIKHAKWYVDGTIHTNTIEGFWALLKRGMFGQFHSVSRRHLQKYVDEFCYRYNLRDVESGSHVSAHHRPRLGGDRMSDKPLEVIAGAPDRPLRIGTIEIECYVLEDKTRVLSRGGFQVALGRHRTSRRHQPPDVVNLPAFLAAGNLNGFISNELATASTPISFKAPARGPVAYGYRATLLPDVCEVYLKARDARVLLPSQLPMSERAEIVMRGLAKVGIIALVDEATGYQEIRAQRALATILEKFIAKELQPWTRTFPYEFYEQIFRLKDWPDPQGVKRPSVIGHYTNDVVYSRLAPGVLDELRNKNPVQPSGRRRATHHQWFTPDIGNPKLKEHLAAVIALMRASANWNNFQRLLNRAFPKKNATIPLPLEDE